MKKIFIATIVVLLVFALPVFAEEPIEETTPVEETQSEEIVTRVDEFKQDVAPVLVSFAAAFSGFATILYFFGKSSAKLRTLFTGASDTYKAVSTKVIETQQSIVGIKENCTNAIKDMGTEYLQKINAIKDENAETLSNLQNLTLEQLQNIAENNASKISEIYEQLKMDVQNITEATKNDVQNITEATKNDVSDLLDENKQEINTIKEETQKSFKILSDEFRCVMQVLKVAYGNNAELSKNGNAEIIHKLIKEFENKFSEVGNDKEIA